MNFSIPYRLGAFFGVAISLVALTSYFYFKSTLDFIESSRRMHTSQQVITQLNIVISLLKDAETGERGFVITRQKVFLEPYHLAKYYLNPAIHKLETLLANHPIQVPRLDVIKPLIDREMRLLTANITQVEAGQQEKAILTVASGQGKTLLDAIRVRVNEMINEEERQLKQLALAAEKDAKKNLIANGVGVTVTSLLLLMGMIQIVSGVKKRQQLNTELKNSNYSLYALNEEMEATNEELSTTNEALHLANHRQNELNQQLQESHQQLQCIYEQLRIANQELESFSYSVSHDLRTPLRSIKGFTQLLQEGNSDQLTEEGQQLLQTVSDNAIRMGEMIDGLLDFARLGNKALIKTSFSMEKVVLQLVEEQKNIMPQACEVVLEPLPIVTADYHLMRLVWTNLLSNAFKFSSKASHPQIRIGSYKAENEFVFYVKDNGAGFNMKYAHQLFGVFSRLHRRTDFDGTGVGLAIVQRIIIAHGGKVWAEAEPGKGATFSFTLPVPV
jgi:signal transduction histidine kinase